jgi:hypothetical protein
MKPIRKLVMVASFLVVTVEPVGVVEGSIKESTTERRVLQGSCNEHGFVYIVVTYNETSSILVVEVHIEIDTVFASLHWFLK